MKSLQSFLDRYISKSNLALGLTISKLIENWPTIAGDYLGTYVQPLYYQRQTLFCLTQHPGLIQEMSYVESQIIQKINEQFPELSVKAVKFTTTPPLVSDKKVFDQQEYLKRKENYILPPLKKLSPNVTKRIEKALEVIQDEDVKEKTSHFLQAVARRQQQLKNKGWKICKTCQTYFEPQFKKCPYCHAGDLFQAR